MYRLYDSTRADKKFMVITPSGHTIHFGAKGYDDFLTHHDENRKERYIARHQKNEKWDFDGIETAGFWSRWLLWNNLTIQQSITDIDRRFDITIEYDSHHNDI